MYIPIPLPPHVTDSALIKVVRDAIDPRLEDVHAMLRLPLPEQGIKAGCNFAIADALFGIIEGVSAALWPRDGQPRELFTRCVSKHYRSRAERVQPFTDEEIANTLYDHFRSPMQHVLGLKLKRPNKYGIREPDTSLQDAITVFRDKESLSESQIQKMEQGGWPDFLHRPTLKRCDGVLYLTVEAFYVGTRRLIASVLADEKEMTKAAQCLAKLDHMLSGSRSRIVHTRPSPTMVNSGTTLSGQSTLGLNWKDESK